MYHTSVHTGATWQIRLHILHEARMANNTSSPSCCDKISNVNETENNSGELTDKYRYNCMQTVTTPRAFTGDTASDVTMRHVTARPMSVTSKQHKVKALKQPDVPKATGTSVSRQTTAYRRFTRHCISGSRASCKPGKASQCWIAERRVPELIPVLGSQPAGDVSHKPGGRLPLLSARQVGKTIFV